VGNDVKKDPESVKRTTDNPGPYDTRDSAVRFTDYFRFNIFPPTDESVGYFPFVGYADA
jgi:hypothetical protein